MPDLCSRCHSSLKGGDQFGNKCEPLSPLLGRAPHRDCVLLQVWGERYSSSSGAAHLLHPAVSLFCNHFNVV